MRKTITIEAELIEEIQKFANKNFNGNFTKAINHLCLEGLAGTGDINDKRYYEISAKWSAVNET